MPNIQTALRAEITRLSRKESRGQLEGTRKATVQHRKDIAALKREVSQLQQQVRLLSRKSLAAPSPTAAAHAQQATKVRFVAKGLRSQRERLGLSAADLGKLVGVSAQSVYNWEGGQTRPHDTQIAKLVQLRAMGKREASARLKQMTVVKAKAPRKKQ